MKELYFLFQAVLRGFLTDVFQGTWSLQMRKKAENNEKDLSSRC